MRFLYCLLLILSLREELISQPILKQYDFNKGGYYICLLEGPMARDRGLPVCPVRDGDAVDTTLFFYTSDTVVLNRLKKELFLYHRPSKNGVADMLQCGYPFWFCVFKDGQLLLKLPANIECGYIKWEQKLFHSKTLKQYKKTFKPLLLKYTCFNTAEERSKFIESIKTDFSYVSIKVFDDSPGQHYFLLETMQIR